MKKIFVTLMFAMAAVAFVAAPAAADIKVTTTGYMQVQSLYLSGLPIKNKGFEGSNNWYNMEMLLKPVLHINDKVRIIAQIRMMERNFSGAAGDLYGGNEANSKWNVWGNQQNNFWLERLYMVFPLLGGQLQIGRLPGGNWGNDFGDLEENRDRILYLRRFGPFTVLGLIEKLQENDGGLAPPRWNNLTNPSYATVDQDLDAYALGAVLPFSKQIIIRPLWYYIRDGDGVYGGIEPTDYHVFFLHGIYDFGVVRFEHEFDYRFRDVKKTTGTLNYESMAVWAGLDFNLGPLGTGVKGFWMKGGTHDATSKDRTFSGGTGRNFQPLLLTFSEDMGLFFHTTGVTNGSVTGESSGYLCFYVPVSFKISDDMKVGGVFGWLQAEKMGAGSAWDGTKANKDLGWEVDVNFTWRFLDNISYVMDAGYFFTGDYFKETKTYAGQSCDNKTQDVYGIRNTIKVEW
jgi:hypothetical protein